MSAEDMQAKVAEVQRLAVETEAEAVSEDGAVRVVAGPAGKIKELDLSYNAFQMSGVELGEVIVSTIRAAGQQVETKLSASVSAVLGDEFTNLGEDEGDRR